MQPQCTGQKETPGAGAAFTDAKGQCDAVDRAGGCKV